VTDSGRIVMPRFDAANVSIPVEFAHLVNGGGIQLQAIGNTGIVDNEDKEDDEPPYMIVTRLPRLLGLNVNQ